MNHFAANIKVSAKAFLLGLFHLAHALFPCRLTSHEAWNINFYKDNGDKAMGKPQVTENFTADAAISPYRICKIGAADGNAAQADGSTVAMFGVSDELGADAAGDRVDIHTAGPVDVEYGDDVTRGDLLTSDANGKAIPAAPAAGVNARVIGIARLSGAAGDIGLVQLAPGQIQGA